MAKPTMSNSHTNGSSVLATPAAHEPRRASQLTPRKVCLVSWAPFLAGAEIAAERLGVGLLAAGHEVLMVVGTRGPALEHMHKAGLRCIYTPISFTDKWHWLRYKRAKTALRNILRHERPDIVHSNDLPTHQIVSDALRGSGIPEVCHHRWIFETGAIDWLNKYECPHHLFVSRFLMDELSSQSPRLAGSSRSVVYDGLPLPPPPSDHDRLAMRRRLGRPSDRILVTFAGQIIERKGVADLLRAWALLDGRLTQQADLLIIGDDLHGQGKYRTAMEDLARELRSPARFLGFQQNVANWLLASDIAVVPSHAEPLGNATLEAMAYGLPVVGSSVGGIPEMVVHEQTGLLVAPRSPEQLAAALTRLLDDQAFRRDLGARGRQRCEAMFSLEAHVAAVLDEYEKVLASPVAGC